MTLPSFTCPQPPVFGAPGGIVIKVPAGELTSVIQTLSQQPGMCYLTDLSQRRDVNWQPVKLAYDQWSYKQEGLTPAGAALLGAAVAWATGGMGADLLGQAFGTNLTGASVNASGRALVNTAVNGGNLEEALKVALVSGLVDTAQEAVASRIGTANLDYVSHKLAHALAGCIAGAAVNGTCRDGAIGGAVGEIVGEIFKGQVPSWNASDSEWNAFDARVSAYGKIVSDAVAAYAGGNAQTAITTAEIAIDNNTRINMRAQAAQNSMTPQQYYTWVRARSLQQAITLNGGTVPPNAMAPGARINYTQSDITRLEGQLRGLSPSNPLIYSPPTATLSPLPYSYVNMQTAVNMNNVPGATGSNAFGFPSGNTPYFRELLRQQPQMFSPTNQVLIGRGQAPQVDAQWIQHNPTHQFFTGQTLHHHHMHQGNIAVAIPQSIHQQWSSIFHPYR